MRGKSLRVVLMAVVVMLALVIAVVPTFAQSSTGSNSNMTGMNNWLTLGPGQSVEYRLQYKGSGSGDVTVMVGGNPANAVNFKVYTDQQWLTSNPSAVGQGTVQQTVAGSAQATPTALYGSNLIWQTNDKNGQLFHIQINNTSGQSAQYWIDATGAGNGGLSQFSSANLQSASAAPQSQTQTAMTTSGTTGTGTTATTGAGTSTTAKAPTTLPVTGGENSNLLVYLASGLALLGAGWLATRKATQR
jgi:LPXTG-motif cell wall-anchored protein